MSAAKIEFKSMDKSVTTETDLRRKLDSLISSMKSEREESNQRETGLQQKLDSLISSMKSEREQMKQEREERKQSLLRLVSKSKELQLKNVETMSAISRMQSQLSRLQPKQREKSLDPDEKIESTMLAH